MIAAFKASAALGRASRKQREGNLVEALAIALGGLEVLRHSYVRRSNPPEGANLASLTALAEAIAWELKVPGAKQQDLIDTLAYLKAANTGNPPPELCAYIPFLESRLAEHKSQNA
ncbi:hypothetical protein [Dechloromonas denitrificans]|uniref:hypothetical protein n=1 Tax=Dechloromonas denitrificans TaxID=281362 RepID=UPI001CFB6ED6|nr:hypothetical protein [Dechloromonas denitrificans]UCV09303.1 hypothetical protein KI615_07190 [Dechloromonas denitrificans]